MQISATILIILVHLSEIARCYAANLCSIFCIPLCIEFWARTCTRISCRNINPVALRIIQVYFRVLLSFMHWYNGSVTITASHPLLNEICPQGAFASMGSHYILSHTEGMGVQNLYKISPLGIFDTDQNRMPHYSSMQSMVCPFSWAVLYAATRQIRQICAQYGGRPVWHPLLSARREWEICFFPINPAYTD